MSEWTKPYYGVQHLNADGKKSRASVTDYGTFAESHFWYPGCAFSPIEKHHDNAEQARAAAEAWLASQ